MALRAPHRLRVEHLDTALGIHVRAPRLSWRLPDGSARQLAYRIRTDNGWDTGRVESDTSLLLRYAGPPLGARQRVGWQVKVWTDQGESDWSAATTCPDPLRQPGPVPSTVTVPSRWVTSSWASRARWVPHW